MKIKKVASGDAAAPAAAGLEFERVTIRLGPGRWGYAQLHDAAREPPMHRGHTHREWEMNLVTRGWAEYVVDGRRVRLDTDALAWLLPGQPHLLLERSGTC